MQMESELPFCIRFNTGFNLMNTKSKKKELFFLRLIVAH